jgi:hypothetical protein
MIDERDSRNEIKAPDVSSWKVYLRVKPGETNRSVFSNESLSGRSSARIQVKQVFFGHGIR